MKVSDIILIVAGVVGVGGAYLSYQNYTAYAGDPFGEEAKANYKAKTPLLAVEDARKLEESRSMDKLEGKEADLATLYKEIADLEADNEGLQKEIGEGSIKRTNLMSDIDRLDRDISKNEEKLNDLKRYLEKFGTAKELRDKVNLLKNQLATANQSLITEKNTLTSLISRQEQLDSSIGNQRERVDMAQSGRMSESFRSQITEVYPRWGFVVISGGVDAGVNASTPLNVMRGADVIGRVIVTTVEPSVSVCSIDEDSFVADAQIRPGDVVVPAPKQADNTPQPNKAIR